ncbi:MAG: hypothetical protein M0R48_04135 [Candidatus Omnitrophica bacterium]|jgi:putative FmdB family regulatory protein|nr:hypothetical protein [Candidatus Omnitrophota bacterium]
MPIYEFKCKDCGKISEFLIGVGQNKLEKKCSFCESKKLEKIFSQTFVPINNSIGCLQGGKTCCGRTERCDKPPCHDTKGYGR